MTLEMFSSKMAIVNGEEADLLRNQYIKTFINTSSEWYAEHIARLIQYRDGSFYTGYLWDCLCKYDRVSMEDVRLAINDEQYVYVMWDVHSSEKIVAQNYWKFPKTSILKGQYVTVIQGMSYLPEDIYIFPPDFNMSVVLTHETDLDNARIMLGAWPCD